MMVTTIATQNDTVLLSSQKSLPAIRIMPAKTVAIMPLPGSPRWANRKKSGIEHTKAITAHILVSSSGRLLRAPFRERCWSCTVCNLRKYPKRPSELRQSSGTFPQLGSPPPLCVPHLLLVPLRRQTRRPCTRSEWHLYGIRLCRKRSLPPHLPSWQSRLWTPHLQSFGITPWRYLLPE